MERGWTIDIERSHLEACALAGFTAIRLLIGLAAHRRPGGLNPAILHRVEAIIDDATDLGLAVVIANNPDPELLAEPQAHLGTTLATVAWLTHALAGRGTELILEPLAAPRQALDNIWNKTAAELIAAVREHDQQRTILLGPRTMNNARFLGELSLPRDEHNLIVGIHHYWPITFTIQGQMWLGKDHIFGNPHDWLGTTWDQTPAQEAELRTGFAQVAAWSQATSRPHGIPWGIWSLAPIFAIYDQQADTFHADLLAALID